MRPTTALLGLGVAAGAMYLLDPQMGRRRRSLLRDKLVHLEHRADYEWKIARKDLANRTRGVLAGAKARRYARAIPEDAVLVERVRSRMGHVISHPHAIEVTADRGRVTLVGATLASETDRLVRAVRATPGVTGIEHRLEIAPEPAELSGPQEGDRRASTRRPRPATRLLAGIAGGILALYARRRGGVLGAALGTAGLGMLSRTLRPTH